MVFKMLNKILAVLVLFGSIDENGWVSVERPSQVPSQQIVAREGDWPVFIRQFGSDRAIIRFPGEPSYTYPNIEKGDLETMWISAQHLGGVHTLLVEPKTVDFGVFIEQRKGRIEGDVKAFIVSSELKDNRTFDLMYRKDEKWVRERVLMSSERFYILQSVSDTLNEEFHLQFTRSFDVENRDQNQVFHREFQSENS